MRDAVDNHARALVKTQELEELDRLSRDWVAQGSRTSSGLWLSGLLVDGATNGFLSPRPRTEDQWDAVEAATLRWTKRAPDSALARLVHADVITRRAWAIRGGGYAHSVPADAWKPFRHHMTRAHRYLIAQKRVASRDPQYYADLVVAARTSSLPQAGREDFIEGSRRYPGYYPLYFAMLDTLLPKWHGDEGQIELFARSVVRDTAEIEGNSMYARLYWYASQSQYGDQLFTRSLAHWQDMKRGFDDVVKRYPDQWNLQNYAKFACDAGDVDTLRKLFARVEAPIQQAWRDLERYEACERLAGRTRA